MGLVPLIRTKCRKGPVDPKLQPAKLKEVDVKVIYEGSVSNSTIETMKSKHGLEFVNAEDHKRQKAETTIKKVSKPIAVFINSNHETLSSNKFTRNALMFAAKEKGVKNFRVLNKEELQTVLTAEPVRIDEIVKGAVARWKAGWGKKKNKKEVLV